MKKFQSIMKSLIVAGVVLAGALAPSRALAADYVVYADGVIPGGGGFLQNPSGNWMYFFWYSETSGYIDSRNVAPVSPQGGNYILSTVSPNATYGGSGGALVVSGSNGAQVPTNLSAYSGGSLVFYLKSDRALQVVIQYDNGSGGIVDSASVDVNSTGGTWQQITIPLTAAYFGSGVDYSKIRVPFLIKNPNAVTYVSETIVNVDDIRWVEPTTSNPVLRPGSTRVNPGKRRMFLVEGAVNPNISDTPANLGTFNVATGNEVIFTAGATLQSGTVNAEKNSLTGTASVQVTNTVINRRLGLLSAEDMVNIVFNSVAYESGTRSVILDQDASLFPYADTLGGTITLTNVSNDKREGTFSVRGDVNVPDDTGFAGAAIEWASGSIDMSEYFDGALRFWFKAPAALSGKTKMSIRSSNVAIDAENVVWLHNHVTFDNTWRSVVIPVDQLAGLGPKADLSRMKVLFNIAVSSPTSGNQQFFLDNVRWDTRKPGPLVFMTIAPAGVSGVVKIPKNLKLAFVARGYDANNAQVDIWPTWSWALGDAGEFTPTQGDTILFTAANAAVTGRLMATQGSSWVARDIEVKDMVFTQTFNVYSDVGAGAPIGVASTGGGTDLGLVEYQPADAPEGVKVMRATFTLVALNHFANWYVNEQSGSRFLGAYSDGYLHFWVKTTKDLEVSVMSNNVQPQFNNAKVKLSELGVPRDGTWQEVWLSLAYLNSRAANQLDFANIVSYFAITALSNDVGLTNQHPFEVDDVKWYTASSHVPDVEKVYIGLKNKQNSSTGLVLTFDNEVNKRAVTYDQALAAMAYTYKQDTGLAKKVLDFYKGRYDAAGGSFAGFHEEFDRDTPTIIRDYDRTAGPTGWIMLAAIHYRCATGSQIYDPMINGIGTWLRGLQAADGAIKFGFEGDPGTAANFKSTEHNLDVYTAFKAWAAITGNAVYETSANSIYTWLTTSHLSGGAWNAAQGRFNVGEKSDGSANIDYALDVYSWAPLALNGFDSVLNQAETLFVNSQTVDLTGFPITGFDFSGVPGDSPGASFGLVPDKDAVWLEGTGQMVLAYLAAGRQDKADFYLNQLNKAVFDTGNGGQGLAYASDVGTAYWYPGYMDSTHAAVSSMAWYLFANWGFNPLQPLPMFDVAVKNISDNAVTNTVTWNVNVPANWTRAAQYIQIRAQAVDNKPWGLQIYTDNTNTAFPPARFQDPTPAALNNKDSDPAGLIMNLPGATTTQHKLDMAWRVMDSTAAAPAAVRPYDLGLGDGGNPEAYNWFYFLDKNTPPIDANGNGSLADPIDGAGFVNGDDYITVKDNRGLHFVGQDFFPSFSPDFIYLEADFGPAAAQINYKANIILEFFVE